MQLIYRGHHYSCIPTHTQSIHLLRAINWRYRLFGAAQIEIPSVSVSIASRSVQPRAINWRYQVPVEV